MKQTTDRLLLIAEDKEQRADKWIEAHSSPLAITLPVAHAMFIRVKLDNGWDAMQLVCDLALDGDTLKLGWVLDDVTGIMWFGSAYHGRQQLARCRDWLSTNKLSGTADLLAQVLIAAEFEDDDQAIRFEQHFGAERFDDERYRLWALLNSGGPKGVYYTGRRPLNRPATNV